MIICASTGRCGSTTLYESIKREFPELTPIEVTPDNPPPSVFQGVIIKTHEMPPEEPIPGAKYIFSFGCPVAAAYSVHAQPDQWISEHYYNMRRERPAGEEWKTRDTLGQCARVLAWTAFIRTRRCGAILTYPSFFADNLRWFLGKEITWPTFRDRSTRITDAQKEESVRRCQEYWAVQKALVAPWT